MWAFIMENWQSISVAIAFLIAMVILMKINKEETVRKIILSLVVQAEKALGSGTGELKYAYVVDKLYDKLPKIISMLYSRKEIDNMIQAAVDKLKEVLMDGKVTLSGYDDEQYLRAMIKEISKDKG